MVMHGFKSFAKKTEVVFDKGINTIIGSNGSGKTNIADSLCFVLGRLSIKSMRAAKARNLLFMGSKYIKPAREAYVELIFDNSDKVFSIDSEEVSLKRIVKYNGQSTYKINNETKTRLEVIEMLALAGIDPYGYNMVLQGQIQSIVKMHPEERRKIIEEVAGIAIYESRKEKSLKELEKTEEKLKEISSVLRERSAYLKNLDRERAQALRFKELEITVKKCKASIINKRISDKNKELGDIEKSILSKIENRNKIKIKAEALQAEVNKNSEEINQINKHIQQATGFEQEQLHTQVANLRAEIEGQKVRKENYENRKKEIDRRISEMQKSIPELRKEIEELKKESPMVAKKSEELRKKKEQLLKIEEEKKKIYGIKSELNSIKDLIRDKERQVSRISITSEELVKQMEDYTREFEYNNEKECFEIISKLREELKKYESQIQDIDAQKLIEEKKISVCESEISRAKKIKEDVSKIDLCPLCQSAITPEHINHVNQDANKKINESEEIIKNSINMIESLKEKKSELIKRLESDSKKLSSAQIEVVKHKTIKDKHVQLKKAVDDEKLLKDEISELEKKMRNLEDKKVDSTKIEEEYDSIRLEIEEISSRTSEDVSTTLLYKERELENIQNIVKRSASDQEEMVEQIFNLGEKLDEKVKTLKEKELQEKELQEKFKKMFEERDKIQKLMQERNFEISDIQSSVRAVEEQVNYLKIGKAKLDAEREALDMEYTEYLGIELIQGSLSMLEDKLKKISESLMSIGSINMRALEVYEDVKKEYDIVEEKVKTLETEKGDIMKIVAEIDLKKKKSFMKTFKAMNELFTENFAKLYTKGSAYLEIDNKENIFEGGISIVVRLAKGKYFDVTSLSGGEQTLVALSLLFAIQEYKPYHFYIFDEIDAALDKRNSERLAGLLNQYMKSGQYIVITHNDAIIMNSNVLYGISMHEGVSKILSLNVGEERAKEDRSNKEGENSNEDNKIEEIVNSDTEIRDNEEVIPVEESEIVEA